MKITIVVMLLLQMSSLSFAESTRYPLRGQSMNTVLSQSDEPDRKMDAVGNPPITRWIYPGYSVYFEYQTVIHSVKNEKQP